MDREMKRDVVLVFVLLLLSCMFWAAFYGWPDRCRMTDLQTGKRDIQLCRNVEQAKTPGVDYLIEPVEGWVD